MKLDAEKLELLQVMLTGLEDKNENIEFCPGDFDKEPSHNVYGGKIYSYTPPPKGQEDGTSTLVSEDTFLEAVKGEELKARYFIGWAKDKEQYRYYRAWEELAAAMGVSEMVALTTKVPKNVAKRFNLFANEEGTVSETLRKLVYRYVKEYMKDNAEHLLFRETV